VISVSEYAHFICVIQIEALIFVQPNLTGKVLGPETNWNTQFRITGMASLNPAKFEIQDQVFAQKNRVLVWHKSLVR
jgi:hypothetical protein